MKANNTTGIRYLHIDYKDKYGNKYIVRYNLHGKNLVVWRGNDLELGRIIAEELAWIVAEGEARFLEWYDYERLDYLASLGTNDGSIKTKWDRAIGRIFGPYKILSIEEPGPVLRECKVRVQCTRCGKEKVMLYKTVFAYKNRDIKYCKNCPPSVKIYEGKRGK